MRWIRPDVRKSDDEGGAVMRQLQWTDGPSHMEQFIEGRHWVDVAIATGLLDNHEKAMQKWFHEKEKN